MKTWQGDLTLQQNLVVEAEITAKIPPDEIAKLCSIDHHLRWVDDTFKKLGID